MPKFDLIGYILNIKVLGFDFGYIKMTSLRPPSNPPAQIHAFLYPIGHHRPKIGQICFNLGFKSFEVLGFGF